MVAILSEAKYATSTGCKMRYSGLTDTLRKKRIPFCEIFDACPPDADVVFVLSGSMEWTAGTIRQLNINGHIPIVICDQIHSLKGCIYSSVCSNINASMKNLLDTLRTQGKQRLALYAFNPNSVSDIGKADALKSWDEGDFRYMDLFPNDGNLQDCYASFIKEGRDYDAVICANNYSAISLVKHLKSEDPKRLDSLTVICCNDSPVSEYYKNDILTMDINHESYGRAAVYIYEALQKHRYLSTLTTRITWDFGNTATEPSKAFSFDFNSNKDTFYEDETVKDMLVVDEYLSSADSTDRTIISELLEGLSTDLIADRCFLSESAVKYRIKRLVQTTGAADKAHLLRVVAEYTNDN
ncbi:MAG: winged helix-turn-helix transcriptional regulator [Clostridia bacterium]|nr:winged helix-turn-helix transcriptional regulator [Clostridia bacterium]